LDGAGLIDPAAHIRGTFGVGISAQFFERNRRNFDVDIDAVQQGAADFSEVLLNLSGRAAALARGIAVEAAFAPVQISTATEYEP
jgi:hypothetical protein